MIKINDNESGKSREFEEMCREIWPCMEKISSVLKKHDALGARMTFSDSGYIGMDPYCDNKFANYELIKFPNEASPEIHFEVRDKLDLTEQHNGTLS